MTAPWPFYGPSQDLAACPVLNGHANTLPDFIGPLDGSARLTIFTEGNHFPVLLPLVFEAFPAWAARQGQGQTQGQALDPRDILVVTLPQPMIAAMLVSGGIRLGNARLTVSRERGLWPDLVMAGEQALRPLARSGQVQPLATVFCRHQGMGMLLCREACQDVATLADLAAGSQRLVTASPREHVRTVYKETLFTLLGPEQGARLWSRQLTDFPGQLDIQHRDLPHALLMGLADAALLFRHLAFYWAGVHPAQLRAVAVPGAEAWGRTICMARTAEQPGALVALFEAFFLEQARTAYPAAGFAATDQFAFGERLDLS